MERDIVNEPPFPSVRVTSTQVGETEKSAEHCQHPAILCRFLSILMAVAPQEYRVEAYRQRNSPLSLSEAVPCDSFVSITMAILYV